MHPFRVLPPLLLDLLEVVSLLPADWLPGAPELVSVPGPPPVDPAPPMDGPPPEPPVEPAPPEPAPPPEPPWAMAATDSNTVTVIINIKLVILLRMVLLLRLSP